MKNKITLTSVSPNLEIYSDVAVIGSSAILLDKEYGDKIDGYGTVIRFNRAPVINFEKFVGSKTDMRVCNAHVFCNVSLDNDAIFKTANITQPKNFIKDQKNSNIIHIGTDGDEDGWAERDAHTHPTSKTFIMNYDSIPITQLSKQPTIGIKTIKLMIQNNVVPHLYGFGVGEGGVTHYWEERDSRSVCHDYNDERNKLKEWEKEEKIKIFR
tara:strand:+ start:243 stop:878 length:636 start_codon:yes stop_codon:yes gene_type:complete